MKSSIVFIGTLIGCLLSDNDGGVSAISKPFGLRSVNNNLSSKLLQKETHDVSNNRQSIIAATTVTVRGDQPIATTISRGGACSDSSIELFAKIGVGTAVEAMLMFSALDKSLNLKLGDATTRIIQSVALLSVIFASSAYGSIVDSGLSAATKQFLDPNEIPVSDVSFVHMMCAYDINVSCNVSHTQHNIYRAMQIGMHA